MKTTITRNLVIAVLSLLFFWLYLSTTFPAFKNNDSPETAAAAYTLGLSHSPGYPLYTMAARVFTLLPAGSPAFRVNIFSIFLSLLVLMALFFITGRLAVPAGANGGYVTLLQAVSVLLAGFCPLFWSQAIDAKGGIYILNLLFLAILLILFLGLFNRFDRNKIWLATFIYFLSLANHWPSMSLVLPVLLYLIYKYRKELGAPGLTAAAFFAAAGLSPYLYMLIRDGALPVLQWSFAGDFNSLMAAIFRKGYAGSPPFTAAMAAYQFREFLRLFTGSYSALFIFSFLGGYALYKRDRRAGFMLIYIFTATVMAVVLYNRSEENLVRIAGIFLLPAIFVTGLLIPPGLAFTAARVKDRFFRYGILAAALIVFSAAIYPSYRENDSSSNFIGYDTGRNIIRTFNTESVYFADGDAYIMPFQYFQAVDKEAPGVRFFHISTMIYSQALENYNRRYGLGLSYDMSPDFDRQASTNTGLMAANTKKIIEKFMGSMPVYYNNGCYLFQTILKLPYTQPYAGLLRQLSDARTSSLSYVFSLYSYRGLNNPYYNSTAENRAFLMAYYADMVNSASYLTNEGDYAGASRLYRESLAMPGEKPLDMIYYHLGLSYKALNERDNELAAMLKAIDKNPGLSGAYLEAGLVYYAKGSMEFAEKMLETAVRLGAQDPRAGMILKRLPAL